MGKARLAEAVSRGESLGFVTLRYAYATKADIGTQPRNVRFVPKADVASLNRSISFAALFRFGSKADIAGHSSDVRFTPKSRHWLSAPGCPLSAKVGHWRLH